MEQYSDADCSLVDMCISRYESSASRVAVLVPVVYCTSEIATIMVRSYGTWRGQQESLSNYYNPSLSWACRPICDKRLSVAWYGATEVKDLPLLWMEIEEESFIMEDSSSSHSFDQTTSGYKEDDPIHFYGKEIEFDTLVHRGFVL